MCTCSVCVSVCVLSFSSYPVRGVAQFGVWGKRGCIAACDWQPHYTIYTEPVREGEGRNRLIGIKRVLILDIWLMSGKQDSPCPLPH